jgi:hypothetical protein
MQQNRKLVPWSIGALLLSAAIGCGGPQKTDPQPQADTATPAKPPNVMLRLDGKVGGKDAHELQPGEILRSGDQMAVNVAVDTPAYVYVAFVSAQGSPQFAFPKSGDQQVTPDSPVRIPTNPDKWITLDKQTGQEDVLVYASSKPIPSTELTNLVTADAAKAKKDGAKKSAPHGPPKAKIVKPKGDDDALSAGSRGVHLDDEEDSGPTSANPNIVVKRFSIQHR